MKLLMDEPWLRVAVLAESIVLLGWAWVGLMTAPGMRRFFAKWNAHAKKDRRPRDGRD